MENEDSLELINNIQAVLKKKGATEKSSIEMDDLQTRKEGPITNATIVLNLTHSNTDPGKLFNHGIVPFYKEDLKVVTLVLLFRILLLSDCHL